MALTSIEDDNAAAAEVVEEVENSNGRCVDDVDWVGIGVLVQTGTGDGDGEL